MAIKRLNAIIRKNLSIVFAAIILSCPLPLAAQFQGFFAQQTVTLSSSGTMTAAATHISVNNLGQAAHSITVNAGGCVVTLDYSPDGTNWFVLAAVTSSSQATAFAQGYFPILRITLNYGAQAGCNGGSYSVQYAGYQNPPPVATVAPGADIITNGAGGYTAAANLFSNSTIPLIWQLTHLVCTNTGGSVAYLQVIDDNSPAATLGTRILYQAGIPAGGIFTYDGPPLIGVRSLALGASNAPRGNAAVATGIDCTAIASERASYLQSSQITSP